MMNKHTKSRLQNEIDGLDIPAAAAAIVQLTKWIWAECRQKTEYPGGIYGEELVRAGFEEQDRYALAKSPLTAATDIAARMGCALRQM